MNNHEYQQQLQIVRGQNAYNEKEKALESVFTNMNGEEYYEQSDITQWFKEEQIHILNQKEKDYQVSKRQLKMFSGMVKNHLNGLFGEGDEMHTYEPGESDNTIEAHKLPKKK